MEKVNGKFEEEKDCDGERYEGGFEIIDKLVRRLRFVERLMRETAVEKLGRNREGTRDDEVNHRRQLDGAMSLVVMLLERRLLSLSLDKSKGLEML